MGAFLWLPYNGQMNFSQTHSFTRIALSVVLACATCLGALAMAMPSVALDGATADVSENPALAAAQKKVTESAEAYDKAAEEVAKLEKQAKEAQGKIDKISAELPEQQAKADAALVSQYKLSQDTSGLLGMIMGTGTFKEFVSTMDYLNSVQEYNMSEVLKLNQMKTELDTTKAQLDSDLAEASKKKEEAQKSLEEAKALRKQLQEKALIEAEKAKKEAEEAAKAEKEKKKSEKKDSSSSSSSNSGNSSSSNNSSTVPSDAPALKGGQVNWDMSKSQFVKIWTKRIDAYLAGSPLAGNGKYFATAAWNYGVDPRWSPAISCVESGKGAHCFKSYNAWGWGSSGWSSWPEAINAHVRGLAVGYGYTVSWENAKKYCPPNAEHWYKTCVSEMNKM